jgi:succinate dehydrogenase/fumarate reductase flavoprotein subunit
MPVSEQPAPTLHADVLVIGGGPAACWAAWSAAERGASVVLVDKGFVGTSGATAPSNTGTWFAKTPDQRAKQIERRLKRTEGLADIRQMHRVIDTAAQHLNLLHERGYAFPRDEDNEPYLANLRGPDYMRFMRTQIVRAGVKVLDHHPALELLATADGAIAGAAGIARQKDGQPWTISAAAIVLATGGCAFGARILGATGLTGDGYLMAAEAGAVMSGMEFSAQYGLAPLGSAVNKGIVYSWASFYRADGSPIDIDGEMYESVARAALRGPIFARLDRAAAIGEALRQGQVNCFLPFERAGVDPFQELYPVVFRSEGLVRGVGGVRRVGEHGETGIPGLYAAGDTLDRQDIAGAATGGGGPNASWAISTGVWAGSGAARHAQSLGPRAGDRRAAPLGQAGLRPAASEDRSLSAQEIGSVIRSEMLPLEKNFFRSGPGLESSLQRLDGVWAGIRNHLRGDGVDALRAREAASMTASARWCYRAALARTETRGIHRRSDLPTTDPGQTHRLVVAGIDQPEIIPDIAGREALAS